MQLIPVGSPEPAPIALSNFQGTPNPYPQAKNGLSPFGLPRVAPLWPEYHNTPLPQPRPVLISDTQTRLIPPHQLNLIA